MEGMNMLLQIVAVGCRLPYQIDETSKISGHIHMPREKAPHFLWLVLQPGSYVCTLLEKMYTLQKAKTFKFLAGSAERWLQTSDDE